MRALLTALAMSCVASTAAAQPKGLGAPPAGLAKIDPKATAFETELLKEINGLRTKRALDPLAMQPKLQIFARKEAETAATGDPAAAKINERIKEQALAPLGYFVQTVYGKDTREALAALQKDKAMGPAMVGEFANAGIGAFWVPEDKPYFQVVVLLTKDADPMAGKPGLSKDQTDPVMGSAAGGVKQCFDHALQRNPNLGGDLLFKITIGDRGQVDDATLLKGLGEEAFDGCVLMVVRGLRFPAPYKGKAVVLNHPMRVSNPNLGRRLGKLTPSQISSTFNRARGGYKECYEGRLKEKPALAGQLTIALTVLGSGELSKLRLENDTLGDATLAECILAQTRELRFPRPQFDGEVDVTYPMTFDPPPAKR